MLYWNRLVFIYTILPCRKPHVEHSHSKWKSYEHDTHFNASLSFWTCPFRENSFYSTCMAAVCRSGFYFQDLKLNLEKNLNKTTDELIWEETGKSPDIRMKDEHEVSPLLLHVFVNLYHWAVGSRFHNKWLWLLILSADLINMEMLCFLLLMVCSERSSSQQKQMSNRKS